MATEWFQNDGSGIALGVGESEDLVIVGDYIPDWVRIPNDSPLRGGETMRVIGHEQKQCPKCNLKTVRHLLLENSFAVAQCKPGCGFVFYYFGG